jgi:preprotein translocase subunit SecY
MLLSYAYHFAQAIMFIPAAVAGLSKSDTSQSIVGAFSNIWFCITCFLQLNRCIYLLYTAITVPTNKMSDDLKRSGGFIPVLDQG